MNALLLQLLGIALARVGTKLPPELANLLMTAASSIVHEIATLDWKSIQEWVDKQPHYDWGDGVPGNSPVKESDGGG